MEAALFAALLVIDNVLSHEGPPPPYSPPVVRELLAQPREAMDAETIFRNALPIALVELVNHPERATPRPFMELLAEYIVELSSVQKKFQAAVPPFDDAALLRRLDDGLVSADQLLRAGAGIQPMQLEVAKAEFTLVTLRFSQALRVAADFPDQALQFDSPIGLVSIGTRGNDRHGPEAALIVDPGGDDIYERRPATGGAVSVIFDLGGNDRYTGSDIAVRGLSAIVDFSGDDRYEMQGPGIGAAIAGVSLLVDYSGNDRYEARYFGQGAAAFGLGALVDMEGNDRYRLGAWGQGFGAAGGTGLLWDRAGDDSYAAAGEPDPHERGAALSGAQGAAFGYRTMLGGGIGILRDESGNDSYEAQLFAQGIGYYYGLGLLWDGHGDDRYRAVRYAQGNGVHQALGVLRDESGNDDYRLTFGVGQGMGLDLAVGVLFDGAGDDAYRAGRLAQGTATANGVGLLADGGSGTDRWEIDTGPGNWGTAEGYRRLPSTGILEYTSKVHAFVLAGRSMAQPPAPRVFHEAPVAPPCRDLSPDELRKAISGLRRDHLDAVMDAGAALRCSTDWPLMEELLDREPDSPLALWIALSLQSHSMKSDKLLGQLDRHPSCDVRAAALEARDDATAAKEALKSTCWRLQAVAKDVIERSR